MKSILLFLLLTPFVITGQNTTGNPELITQKMALLSNWVGQWTGEGTISMMGETYDFVQTEDIRFTLDGQVLVIEGIGHLKDNPEEKVHHAFATISYHPDQSAYIMRSYTNEGLYTDATVEVIDEVTFKWHFDVPQGRILYKIENDGTSWSESGSYQNDSGMSFPFFDMLIHKNQ